MGAVSNVLIVGAGPAGLSSAVALRQAGVGVEVVEMSATRQVPGSELMIGGRSCEHWIRWGWPNAVSRPVSV